MNAMSELGLLGLIVPKELGGLGENHVCSAMVSETIARYGCPSTAMVYSEYDKLFIECRTREVLYFQLPPPPGFLCSTN